MNVAILNTDAGGGAGIAATRLHKGLMDRGVSSSFVYMRGEPFDGTCCLKAPGSLDADFFLRYIWQMDRSRGGKTLVDLMYSESMQALPGLLKDADVVSAHWVSQFASIEALYALRRAGKPLVWTLHDENVYTGVCHYRNGCEGHLDGCRRCPQVTAEYRPLVEAVFRAKATHLPTDAIFVCPSQWIAAEARRSRLLGGCRIEVIPNGVDVGVFHPDGREEARRALGFSPEDRVILFGAWSLEDRRKGADLLLEAIRIMARYPAPAQAISLGQLKGITFGSGGEIAADIPMLCLGPLPPGERLAMAYRAADVLALPSREDNLPNVMIEALACGTPVVATRVGGIPDAVRDGETGFLASAEDAPGFAAALLRVLFHGGIDRAQCRRRALACYDLREQAQRYEALFSEALSAREAYAPPAKPDMAAEVSALLLPDLLSAAVNDIYYNSEDTLMLQNHIRRFAALAPLWHTKRQYILFGSGLRGRITLGLARNQISFIVDNDPAKWGTELAGVAVYPPEKLLECADPFIFITPLKADAIKLQLQGMGYTEFRNFKALSLYGQEA
ncbi:D-inositol-3-phosphate glycosyltransferase [bioreactor metagenome]|uniref:D-inositol-3-phosphate glycosyltransferase n=1 Tax=bioreactor metagenome TaxID=1076179 RepID=A0A644Z6I5_9ZZZZ